VCPFSIAFLVFINSSISFVVTDLIGLHDGEGDAVGTLGFADELLALAACPLWGVLSDRIGVRHVSHLLVINGCKNIDLQSRYVLQAMPL
jgi:MFS family permease